VMNDGRDDEGGGEEGFRAAFEAVRFRSLKGSAFPCPLLATELLGRRGGGVGVVGYCEVGMIRGVICEGSPVNWREWYEADEEDACWEDEPAFDSLR